MPGLIQVELRSGDDPATEKERQLIADLLRDFPDVSLEDSVKETAEHPGPVQTSICSLKRAYTTRLGYGSAEYWRRLT